MKIAKLYNDKYFGRRLILIDETSASRKQFRANEHYIARNEDGMIGHMGDGIGPFLQWLTEGAPWAFNPLKTEDIVWVKRHHAFFFKHSIKHTKFPIIIGEFYTLKNGVKRVGPLEMHEVRPHAG